MQSIADYSEQMENMLQKQILPFWLQLVDHENGGFYGYVDHAGVVKKDANKGIILHSRILWTFAESYRFTGKKEYLDAASHCYRFLIDKAMDKRYGGLYWMLDGKGEPIEDFKHAYNQAFGVYALSAYYLASQSQEALSYAKTRIMFDKPIGGFQLQQERLADMITEIVKAQLVSLHLGRLKDAGTFTPQQVSLAKRNNVNIATNIAREARRLLGANGILAEYSAMRHMANLESVYTYEGTHDVHSLILGQAVTGLNAFN